MSLILSLLKFPPKINAMTDEAMVIAGTKQIDVMAPETKEMENTDVDHLP